MKTPGEICYKAGTSSLNWVRNVSHCCWESLAEDEKQAWEAAAAAVLSSQWRPVSEPPEDEETVVFCFGGGSGPTLPRPAGACEFESIASDRTHWMPIPPLPSPPEPTPEERERAEFEAWMIHEGHGCDLGEKSQSGTAYMNNYVQCKWLGWQAARAAKEEGK